MHDNQNIERLILGAILKAEQLGAAVNLKSEYFTDVRNQTVFDAMLELAESDLPVDAQRVTAILTRKGIERGADYIRHLGTYEIDRSEMFSILVDKLKMKYMETKSFRAGNPKQ